MKFTSVLAAIVLSAVAVSALPCGHSDSDHSSHNHEENFNYEDNSNRENNSKTENKEIHQTIGDTGSSGHSSGGGGLLGELIGDNLLAGGILSHTTTNTYNTQNANVE